MLSFMDFVTTINEDYMFLAEAKNLHMEHLEDEIFNNGIEAYHIGRDRNA